MKKSDPIFPRVLENKSSRKSNERMDNLTAVQRKKSVLSSVPSPIRSLRQIKAKEPKRASCQGNSPYESLILFAVENNRQRQRMTAMSGIHDDRYGMNERYIQQRAKSIRSIWNVTGGVGIIPVTSARLKYRRQAIRVSLILLLVTGTNLAPKID